MNSCRASDPNFADFFVNFSPTESDSGEDLVKLTISVEGENADEEDDDEDNDERDDGVLSKPYFARRSKSPPTCAWPIPIVLRHSNTKSP